LFLKSLDMTAGTIDSVALGNQSNTAFVVKAGRGFGFMGIPFTPHPLIAIDPGGAIWTAVSDVDRVVKLSPKGDTLLVVDMPGGGPDLAPDERAKEIDREDKAIRQMTRGVADADMPDWDKLVPKKKPVLMSLTVDDAGRLWIERATLSRGPMFDVLTSSGQLLGTVDPDFSPAENSPITIRGKSIYAVLKVRSTCRP